MTIRLLICAAALLMLVGVGAASAQDVSIDAFDGPGAYTLGFMMGGLERRIHVYIPESFDPDEPMPLVLVLHGAGGTGANVASLSGFNELADEEGFIVVYPDGYGGGWNDARLDLRTLQVDDLGFFRNIVDFLTETLPIDENRIYSTGYSMGGMMSFRLGCQLPNRIAAVASVASPFPAYQLDACLFADPVPVLAILGTADIGYTGYRDNWGNRAMMSADETRRYWADKNGCTDDVTTTSLPDTEPDDQTRVRLLAHDECANGADVLLYIVRGGGHTWPGSRLDIPSEMGHVSYDIDAARVVWEFFEAHPKQDAAE